MILLNKPLKKEVIENYSMGFNFIPNGIKIANLKKGHYRLIGGTSVGGDAPKELLRVYEYQKGKKQVDDPKKWNMHIAKTGHKWYPYESITEFVLNKIGEQLGLRMAESSLYMINGQLRFLSKVFREKKNHSLIHGAELYAGHLQDKDFVEEIENNRSARDFFTLSFTWEVIRKKYGEEDKSKEILLDFFRMLIFDAIVGNNDRHFYNWAILTDITGEDEPRFSPIYDTARALFWNRKESFFNQIIADPKGETKILNYIKNSKPKIGLENKKNPNHFDIVKSISKDRFLGSREVVEELLNDRQRKLCLELFNDDLGNFYTLDRKKIISKCLDLRFRLLMEEVKND